MKIIIPFIFCFVLFLISSCSKGSPDKRRISPSTLSFANIQLNLTKDELKARIPDLECPQSSVNEDPCLWRLTDSVRKGSLHNLTQVRFKFVEGKLKTFLARYSQMLDVEYHNLERSIRSRYANSIEDTVATTWLYDSLKIFFIPNQRPHWTGKLVIYEPTVEFREEINTKQ